MNCLTMTCNLFAASAFFRFIGKMFTLRLKTTAYFIATRRYFSFYFSLWCQNLVYGTNRAFTFTPFSRRTVKHTLMLERIARGVS